ncbi:MAG: family clan aspartic protease [Alphaproteobacteria bacterium]|nr:family clan aspartic protease [Alphaproteobacteria bacterium]
MNDADQALNFIYLVGCLALVVSALVVRRIPIGHGIKMAAVWVLLFLAVFAAYTVKDDLASLGRHVWAQGKGEGEVVEAGKEIRIRKSLDGHFWVYGRINGEKIHFLIDSGATVTSISTETADRAGIDYRGGFPTLVQTANGIIPVQRGRAGTLKVGAIVRRDFDVHVSQAFGDTAVLGMNFLSSLRSWGVEGPWLVLRT